MTSDTKKFTLLNSAGRLENANKIVEILTTKSKTNITKIISKIYNLNNQKTN